MNLLDLYVKKRGNMPIPYVTLDGRNGYLQGTYGKHHFKVTEQGILGSFAYYKPYSYKDYNMSDFRKVIKDFYSANVSEAVKKLTFGFELETSRFDGMTYDDLASSYDDETIMENCREYAREIINAACDFDELIPEGSWARKNALAHFKREFPEATDDALLDHAADLLRQVRGGDIDWKVKVQEELYLYSEWRIQHLMEELAQDLFENQDITEEAFPEIANVEFGEDASVGGPEIRTIGGLSFREFSKALREVTSHNLRTHNECSFHVHLQLKGVSHTYGERLSSALMEYVAKNYKSLPENVQNRLSDPHARRFFRMQFRRDKMTFVNWHGQGTLEFRLFGNVNNWRDGMKCLIFAVRALQYAYRCVYDKKFTRTWTHEEIQEVVNALDNISPEELNQKLEDKRKNKRKKKGVA